MKTATETPSPETLRKILRYEPDTGRLFWRRRTREIIADEPHCRMWNTRFAGQEAFTATGGGYRRGTIFDRMYRAHRVIWAMVYGVWPADQIDHINGDRSDNRIANLRAVSLAENNRNAARRSDNKSGICGVGLNRASGKWRAQIRVAGRQITLGYFTDIDAAVAARKAAEAEHGFHENHGRKSS